MRSILSRMLAVGASALAVVGSVATASVPAQAAPPGHQHSTIRTETFHDHSAPLASMAPAQLRSELQENEPIRQMPNRGNGNRRDPVVQSAPGVGSAPTLGTGFDGIGQGFTGPAGTFSVTGAPPDTNAAVGSTQVVEIVNTAFAVFSKTGTVLFGPAATNTLWSGFGGSCQTTNDGDGVVRYDSLAGRWVITQFANVGSANGPFFECVAVSQTSDATGSWNRYSFQYASFPDYPKLSVWPDAYYVTYNLFNGNTFAGAEDCAMNRAAMLAGTTANQQCFTTSTSFGGLLGADFESGTAPPAGEANTVIALGTTGTTLASWKFHVDFTTPANSTFTGPTTITVASYTPACGSTGTCIPQSGTSQQLDSLSDRVMFRLAYRNFGDHESLVTNDAVTSGSSVGIRWYEFRNISGTPSVFQQGTFAPDATFRWMGSIAMDKVGNIGLGYSASSSSIHPQIRVTGRLAGDATGTMTQGESTIVSGAGSQTGSLSRWGDYSSMVVDPADGCTFWYAQEYIPSNGSFNWRTHLNSFTLPGCATQAGNDFSLSVSPTTGTVTAGGSTTATVGTTLTSGTAESVSFSASGLPTGATASFSPASVTAGGSSTMTLSTSASTPAGSYSVTVTGTAASATHSTTFTLTVNGTGGCASPGQKIANPGFESGNTPWTATAGVLGNANGSSGQSAHTGTHFAWLDGYGTTHTDTLSQSVTIPAGCTTYTLSFWLHIDTAETTTTTQFDKLTIQLGTTTLGTFSNLNHANGYAQRSFNVASFAGQTVTLKFTGTEDSSLQTSFVIDDTALNVS
jgi:hypothetical protein